MTEAETVTDWEVPIISGDCIVLDNDVIRSVIYRSVPNYDLTPFEPKVYKQFFFWNNNISSSIIHPH